MKKIITNLIFTSLFFSILFANNALAQTRVVMTGTFQSELGCSGDWLPDCDNSALTYNSSTGLWAGTFKIPAGCHQYKVTLDGNWNINYGETGIQNGANIPLYVPTETSITFTYNPSTHIVQTSPVASGFSTHCLPQVVLVGEFQSELGCNFDWDANCTNTALFYNPSTGKFERDLNIPPGSYQYRTVLNGDWVNNFGSDGTPSGYNYSIYIPCLTTVHFSYDPITHIVTTSDQPSTVVVAGSFQSELGCTGDWQPNCDNTRLTYNPNYGAWVDTFDVPAGHWEYKITINYSWDENYGLYGERNGPNIPLDLCYPGKVVFTYYHYGCYNYAFARIITNGVCLNKFYDANVNQYPDPGEEPMSGVSFTLSDTSNGIKQTQTTDNDGKAAFTNLSDGIYVIKENVPSGYYAVTDSQFVYVFGGNAIANFGNVCLGAGGAKGMGFWISKNGEAALNDAGKMEEALWWLRNLALRNADGSDFDPYTYADFRTWMMRANAKNMANMLSAQLAAMFLNTELGYVDRYNSYIYTPGCGFWGNGNFMNVSTLIDYTNYYLLYQTTKDPGRTYVECLKNSFDNANNNLTFVQPHPCGAKTTNVQRKDIQETSMSLASSEIKLWPNPSNNYFTLRPDNNANKEAVQLKVYNINGQEVYMSTGSSNKDYRFGERFTPGIYMVEFIQGNTKKTFKLVKQ